MNKEILEYIIDKQFKMNGWKIRFKDLIEQKDHLKEWYMIFYTSSVKEDKFKRWLTKFIQRTYKYPFELAFSEAGRFLLNYGLRTYDNTKSTDR